MSIMFELGRLVATPGALRVLEETHTLPNYLLHRHATGDWGDLDKADIKLNNEAVKLGNRILSSYQLNRYDKIWIITEADRSVTTILLPEEY